MLKRVDRTTPFFLYWYKDLLFFDLMGFHKLDGIPHKWV